MTALRLIAAVVFISIGASAVAQQAVQIEQPTAYAVVQSKASVEVLPIEGIMKVTEADGSVKFLSLDRRFVFVGRMYDLWNGEAMTADVETNQKMDFERNGVSIDKISFPIGDRVGRNTLFIAPECEDCKALLRLALETKKDDLNVVLLASSQQGHRHNSMVWCSKDRVAGLKTVYLKNEVPDRAEVHMNCDRFGLMLADQASKLFGIGQLPLFVDSDGNGFTGEPAILAVTN